jgi:hypothetical protein
MTTGTHPLLKSILPPEERHVVQFDIDSDSLAFFPRNERERDALEQHLLAAGIRDYTIRTLAFTVDENGKLIEKWFEVRSRGTYAK